METKKFEYSGPVMRFDKCINPSWKAYTIACSEKKAKNNLSYRFKMENCLAPNANVSLPEKLKVII